jgi:hypothetical protein
MSLEFLNKDYVQEDIDAALDSNDKGRDDGATGKEIEDSLKRDPKNVKENLGAKLLNAP